LRQGRRIRRVRPEATLSSRARRRRTHRRRARGIRHRAFRRRHRLGHRRFPRPRGGLGWQDARMSSFDRLSPALQYQIVNTLGFDGLRPVQEESTQALLDGNNAVVLAPTAGGKTEAAFFPALSLMDTEDWAPVSVIYLSPIRALLNNQETRVSKYAGMLGRRAFKWHGDVTASQRKKFLRDPADILLTTPESIEAMLMS